MTLNRIVGSSEARAEGPRPGRGAKRRLAADRDDRDDGGAEQKGKLYLVKNRLGV